MTLSKCHFLREERGLLGEMADFRFRPRHVQDKTRLSCHTGNHVTIVLKDSGACLSTNKMSNYNGSKPLNWLEFSGS